MADTTNTNVFFKKGSQSSLNALTTVTNGAFYLTEDTHRLYVGQNDDLVLLNQSINFITVEAGKTGSQTLVDLGNSWGGDKAYHINEVYYVLPNGTDGNILAIWTERNNTYSWTQINPDTDTDTKITDFITEIAADEDIANKVKIDSTISATNGLVGGNITKGSAFNIKGSGSTVKVEVEGTDTVAITGDTYSMAVADDGDDAKINLSSALGQASSTVGFKAGDNVTLNVEDGSIEISSDKWVPTTSNSTLEVVDGKISLLLKEEAGDDGPVLESNELYFTVGAGEGTGVKKNVLINGDLGVYTAAQVDAKLRGLNGMTYRSTVGPANTTVSASYFIKNNAVVDDNGTAIEVSNGDLFLVVCDKDGNNNPIPIVFNGYDLVTGDLIIAVGTEDEDGFIGSDLAWNIVPAGNDTVIDTTYKFEADATNHKIALMSSRDGSTGEVGVIDLEAGDDIVLTSESQSDGKGLKTTIKHAAITTTTPAVTTVDVANGETGISVIESLEISNGHVTKVVSKKLDLPKYSLSTFDVVDSSSLAKDIITISSVLKADDSVAGEIAATYESETLQITCNSAEGEDPVIGFELTWGTF